jgi:hypothetical protein
MPTELLTKIKNDSLHLRDQTVWRSNLTWDQGIVKSSSLVLIRHLGEEDTEDLKKELFKHAVYSEDQDLTFRAMTYLWSPLSFIPWHLDKNWIGAATIYLNDTWDHDWGGYLMWEDKAGIHATPPVFNRMVVNDANVKHSTTLTTKDANLRETIQIFWF